jgi:AcrR family transcriptional regulator
MRADARRNSELLLDAARDVFVERGPEAPLEEIARRAGVGIATLYRRFVDRPTLIRALVLSALTATIEAAERAQHDHADPFAALTAYVHATLDLRTSAVIATLLDVVDLDEPELKAARETSARLADHLLDTAREAGALRADVTFGDVGIMLVRLSRPLPGSIPVDVQAGLAHRHADVFLAGLRAQRSGAALDGPALDLADLQALRREQAT